MRLSVVLAILPAAIAVPAPAARSEPAPLIRRDENGNGIQNQWIVKFKNSNSLSSSSPNSVSSVINSLSVAPDHVFGNVFKGFAGQLNEKALEALRNNPEVEYIEQDSTLRLDEWVDQTGAPWGLARISQRPLLNYSTDPLSYTYTYDSSAGTGTCAYIVDSGVDVTHPEFEGRASWAANFGDNINEDGVGHGTHVAGTVGSKTYGVAKKTTIYAVKVTDTKGKGTTAQLIAGLDFVVKDAPKRNCPKGVVTNVSIGDSRSTAVNAAAAALVANNIFLAVSAGNDNTDAGSQSPASEQTVCTIGATDSTDRRSSFSNFGLNVDVFAPGTGILSTIPGGGAGYKSGTSMATPHATGLAAYLAGLNGFPGADALCTLLKETATNGLLRSIPSSTINKMIFNGNLKGDL
ncbi:unnamed protein product [Clonostachys solani]|uniref:Cuticle-degrading protease n=1 Tax=Clonostachys solani TaxID=160281 RepID=A0A9N9YZW7_9HYPO|nr:unnamed protein product [Clonostachys solani]